jgi:ABC-type sugar transport system ATPase subunit
MDDSTILSIRNIRKRFGGTQALDNVSLDITRGEVHAVVGENGAGKSTLMKIVSGVYAPDSGEVILDGRNILPLTIKERQEAGISMVYQEINIFPNLSIARNVFASREPKGRLGFIDKRKMLEETRKLIQELGVNLKPDAIVGLLSVAEKQLTQIILALSYNAKMIILDEANTSLTNEETRKLFRIINDLKKRGITVVFVSHRIEQVKEIADRVTVLRDGHWAATLPKSEATVRRIVKEMIGRDMEREFPQRPEKEVINRPIVLKVDNLSSEGWLANVSFELAQGEILGVAGLEGSGKSELGECLIGARKIDKGKMFLFGEPYMPEDSNSSIKKGMRYVPPDRRWDGLIPEKSIAYNIGLSNFERFKKRGLVSDRLMNVTAQEYVARMKIKTTSVKQEILDLSGGNQQKVVFSRVLVGEPRILILNEPTRGIDVGTKYEVYLLMQKLASEGLAIVFISSEIAELMALSDRILALCKGRLEGELNPERASEEEVLSSIMGKACSLVA